MARHYELKLFGEEALIELLEPYTAKRFSLRREANAKKRALDEIFGDAIEVKIVSVIQIPAKVRRHTLKS